MKDMEKIKTPEYLDRVIEFVKRDCCGEWCEYYGGDCKNNPQLSDYCPLYNPTTGKRKEE